MPIHFVIAIQTAFVLFFTGYSVSASSVEATTDRYAYDISGKIIDFGVQPLAIPTGLISAVMQHDRVLREGISKNERKMRQFPFAKGADMLSFLGDDKLEAAIMGDMPTLLATVRHNVLVVALAKQSSSAVVARRYFRPSELKGKRIGYAYGSTAHYTLLEGLASTGLTENDAVLSRMNVDEMPNALNKGDIDAFSAWEPWPTIALNKIPSSAIIYKGLNSSYLVMSRGFVEQQPVLARQFIVAYVRAIYWMQQSRKNLEQAARWALVAHEAFSGHSAGITREQIASIAHTELLDVAAIPIIPQRDETVRGALFKQFEFLKKIGKIDENVSWTRVQNSIAGSLLTDVLANPGLYGDPYQFNYAISPSEISHKNK